MRAPARSKAGQRQAIVESLSLPAPYKGWNARDPEALMDPAYAISMINVFPTAADVGLRAGANNHATGFLMSVKALHSYAPAAALPRLFASTDTGLYDVTNLGPVGAVASAHTVGQTQAINYSTSGGKFLLVVNGQDPYRTFNGTTWTSLAEFNIVGGSTILASQMNNLTAFKRRIFFIEKASTNVYTLPVDSITGLLDPQPIGPIFTKGGFIMAVGTWTLDGGQGVDDRIVFVTSKGQVAVYEGTDPTNPDAWALRGVYDCAEPVGPNCLQKWGGDLLYLSRAGLFTLSDVLQTTTVASAISDTIRTAFTGATQKYGSNTGWCMVVDEPNSLLIINVPLTTLGYSIQFVMNTVTKRWCQFQNWDAFSFVYHHGQIYMGMSTRVARAYSGLHDFGEVIVGTTKQAFSYLNSRGVNKQVKLLRPVLKIQGGCSVECALDMDFRNDAIFGPTNFVTGAGATWAVEGGDVSAVWDEATWADNAAIRLNWLSVASFPGYAAAIRLRFTTNRAKVSWTATDVLFEKGGYL
jgi:hypothetical protein